MASAEELKVYALGGRRVVYVVAGRGEGLRAHLGSRGFPAGVARTPGFDRLEVGTRVRFAEEQGFEGPQASTVSLVGKED